MKWTALLATAQGTDETIIGMERAADAPTTTLTQENGAPPAAEEPQPRQEQNPYTMLIMFGAIFVMMYLIMFRGPKKKQQEHQKMVASLKKNDRVRTIGGIYGTVLEVRSDEVVLKVDEGTNAKLRVIPSAIATVLGDGEKNQ